MKAAHHAFFRHDGPLSPWFAKIAQWLDKRPFGRVVMGLTEDPLKKLLLSCLKCGDCGIQHLAFLCPESQCPKHIRNGACGGSRDADASLPGQAVRVVRATMARTARQR
jgi:methylenetetrahydrofolate reductase (NADPH)